MYQQQNSYGYQPQPQAQFTRPQYINFLKGRPVSSLEEVRAMSVDFDGSISYFPDIANNKIYTKQVNMDGTSTVLMYEMKEIPAQQEVNNDFITREEFEKAISELMNRVAVSTPVVTTTSDVAPVEPIPHFNF